MPEGEAPKAEVLISNLTKSLGEFVTARDKEIDTLRRRSSRLILALGVLILVGILVGLYGIFQVIGFVKDIEQTQTDVAAISGAPQGGAATNRKFAFIVAECQKSTNTISELDKCVGKHFKLQYRCGQDVHDNRICTPFFVKPN